MNSDDLVRIYFLIFPMRLMRYHAYRIEKFVERAAKESNHPGRKVIDIGSHDNPYKKYFDKTDYFSQDIKQSAGNTIDYVGDINEGMSEMPPSAFDSILCTQVLEHLNKPHKAFQEFHRILRPGGKVFLTTHLCFEEHMVPYDYFRFTRHGLKFLGESAGFELIHIAPHGGVFHVISYLVGTLPIRLFFKERNTFSYYAYVFVFSVPILILNAACSLLDLLDRDPELTLNYECIYEKRK